MTWPGVSVIIPVRNELHFIERSLGAMRVQDYEGPIEFILVDGESDDGTRTLLDRLAADPDITVLDNPERNAPAAMNLGAAAARHPILLRMDAHSIAEPDYVRQSVDLLQRRGAVNAGGRWTLVGEGWLARAIAAAMTSPFGTGGAAWRTGTQELAVDTVPYGCWRKDGFLEAGGFDPTLSRNEDYELNIRLRRRGEVWYSPAIHCRYFVRPDLARLARQYFDYGTWKTVIMRLYPGATKARHLAAPAFVAGLVVGLPLSLAAPPLALVYAAGIAAWLGLASLFAVRAASREGWDLLPGIVPVFAVLHGAWGLGFWYGLIRRPTS